MLIAASKSAFNVSAEITIGISLKATSNLTAAMPSIPLHAPLSHSIYCFVYSVHVFLCRHCGYVSLCLCYIFPSSTFVPGIWDAALVFRLVYHLVSLLSFIDIITNTRSHRYNYLILFIIMYCIILNYWRTACEQS